MSEEIKRKIATKKHFAEKELEHTLMRNASVRECIKASRKVAQAHITGILNDLKERVEELKKESLKKQKEGAERLNIRINREATEKLKGLNDVLQIIDEVRNE